MYKVESEILIIDDIKISFEYPVYEYLEVGEMLICRLDYFDKVIPIIDNIFGVSLLEKRVVWQIEKRKYPDGGYPNQCSFVGMRIIENQLWLYNWCSTSLIVEPITGKVLREVETR